MRSIALALCVLLGCAAADDDDDGPTDARTIEFLVPGTFDPLPDGGTVDTYLRTQGDWGTQIDIRVHGVPLDAQANFTIALVGPTQHDLAAQKFLPTHTAMQQDDGTFTIAKLPVVFFEDVAEAEVSDAPATMSVTMMCDPPATGELEVRLELVPPPG